MSEKYKCFTHKECEYYPCHEGIENFNCLFCYCPLYTRNKCPGNPAYIEISGKKVKDCTGCTFPHDVKNYETMMKFLKV